MFPTELPQRTVPDVSETSPGLRWCKVGGGGGGGVEEGGPLTPKDSDQSASALHSELCQLDLPVPPPSFFSCVESCVFVPVPPPSRRTLITGSIDSPSPQQLSTVLSCESFNQKKSASNKEVRGNVVGQRLKAIECV